MNRNIIHAFLAAFIAIGPFALSACKSDPPTGTDTRTPAIYGKVLDASGNPVVNAGVSLLFSYGSHAAGTSSPLIIMSPNPVADAAAINFSVQEDDQINLRLLRADTRALVQTLVNQHLQAGQHTVIENVRDIPNQAYIVQLTTSSDTTETLLVVNNPELDDVAPLLRTDDSGSFTIQYSSLPIGRLFERIYENGVSNGWMEIGKQLDISIIGPGDKKIIWSLQVNTTAVVDSTLRLP